MNGLDLTDNVRIHIHNYFYYSVHFIINGILNEEISTFINQYFATGQQHIVLTIMMFLNSDENFSVIADQNTY